MLGGPYRAQDSRTIVLDILNVRSESALKCRQAAAFNISCLVVHLILMLELCAVNAVDSSAYGHWILQFLENDFVFFHANPWILNNTLHNQCVACVLVRFCAAQISFREHSCSSLNIYKGHSYEHATVAGSMQYKVKIMPNIILYVIMTKFGFKAAPPPICFTPAPKHPPDLDGSSGPFPDADVKALHRCGSSPSHAQSGSQARALSTLARRGNVSGFLLG